MRALLYSWKAQASWGWLPPLLLLSIMLALLLGDVFRPVDIARSVREVALVLEVYLPLVLVLLVARVPALDRELGAAELHLSWRRPAEVQFLALLALPVAVWGVAVAGTVGLTHSTYLPLTWDQIRSMALYPAAGLGGIALAGSALARHQVGGVATAGLWWAIDLQTHGELNSLAYLFSTYRPAADLEPGTLQVRLLLIGLAGLLLALWLAGRRERWVSSAT